MSVPRIALTSGEPAGIGPELCLAIARESLPCALVCLGDRDLLTARARQLSLPVALRPYDPSESALHVPGTLAVEHVPLAVPCIAGRLDVRNARYVVTLLERAADGALGGEFAAMVTAPVHKGLISDSGLPFTGHTEYLAERTGSRLPVMLLATASLRVALATTHIPLKDVSAALTIDLLTDVLAIIDRDVSRFWGLSAPRIAVCGLNPHAGEGGHLGREEITVIEPAIARARTRGIQASGPVAADTIFVPRLLADFDVVLAMYHDQGLPVLKYSGFDSAVNVTLGLPIVRTSVDHGTAIDLAGTGRADAGSLIAAVRLAAQIVSARG